MLIMNIIRLIQRVYREPAIQYAAIFSSRYDTPLLRPGLTVPALQRNVLL